MESVELLSKEELSKALPKGVSPVMLDTLTERVNEIIQSDDYMRQSYRDNVVGFSTVLQEGRFKVKEYLNAVRFVSYRLAGKGVTEAYAACFPERYKKMVDDGASRKYISSLSTQYNKSRLVGLITEQSMIPVHILNVDVYQKAIAAQVELMTNANSEMVRTQAANSIMNHLKAPVESKLKIDMAIQDSSIVEELKKTTRELAKKQLEGIESGLNSVIDVAHSTILEERTDD